VLDHGQQLGRLYQRRAEQFGGKGFQKSGSGFNACGKSSSPQHIGQQVALSIRCSDQHMGRNLRSMAFHGCALVVDYRRGKNGSIPHILRGA
jgi:hypothetical protein